MNKKIIRTVIMSAVIVSLLNNKVIAKTTYEEIKYGKSVNDRDLVCIHIDNDNTNTNKKILLTFAIHGYEDIYPKDGSLLVDIANNLVNYYKNNRDKLGRFELYIIPLLNPDGLYDGYTNNGFGRCQSEGIDMNRDFDYNFKHFNNERNHNGYKPFMAKESRHLKDLTEYINPNVVIDVHGYLDTYYGDFELYKELKDNLPLKYSNWKAEGYYAAWTKTLGAKALLLELPKPSSNKEEYINNYSNQLINALNNYFSKTIDKDTIIVNNKELHLEKTIVNSTMYYSLEDIGCFLNYSSKLMGTYIILTKEDDTLIINTMDEDILDINNNYYIKYESISKYFNVYTFYNSTNKTINIFENKMDKPLQKVLKNNVFLKN